MGNGGVAAGEELVDRGHETIGSNGPDPGIEALGITDDSTAIRAGAHDLDRGIRSNRAPLQHPREPSSPARQRPHECGPALEPGIGQRMENRARIAGFAYLQHDLAEAHTHAWPQRVRRKAGHRQVLADVARLHGPSFGPEVGQGLLAQEQDGLVRVAAGLLGPPAIEVALHAVRRDDELRDRALGEPA